MCDFRVSTAELTSRFDVSRSELDRLYDRTNREFDSLLSVTPEGLSIPPEMRALTRLIARSFDAYELSKAGHSSAI